MSSRVGFLAEYPVVTEIPVLWGDMDSFGHVNNVVYVRWCESGRVDYLRRLNLFAAWPPQGVGVILAGIQCNYRVPLNYPDTVQVGTRVSHIGNSSIRVEHAIVSLNLHKIAADATSTVVLFNYDDNRSVPVPAELRKLIAELEGKTL